MIRLAILVMIIMAVTPSLSARAEPTTLVSAGSWVAVTEGGNFAVMGHVSSGNIAFVLPRGSRHFSLVISRDAWTFPPGTPVPIIVGFDTGTTFSFSGVGRGSDVFAPVNDGDVRAWTHAFTALQVMSITFPGRSETPWSVSLAGTTPVVEALSKAMEVAGLTGLPDPWNPRAPAIGVGTPAVTLDLPPQPVRHEYPECSLPVPLIGIPYGWTPEQFIARKKIDCNDSAFARDLQKWQDIRDREVAAKEAVAQMRSQEALRQQAERAAVEQQKLQQAAQDQSQEAERVRMQQIAMSQEQAKLAAIRAQEVAEQSAANACKKPEFARQMMQAFDRFKSVKNLDYHTIDIEHLTTDALDADGARMVCHGTFLMDSGAELTGNFEMRKNVAGDIIYLWAPDSSDGGAAHAKALQNGSARDLQAVVGAPGASPSREIIVVPANHQ